MGQVADNPIWRDFLPNEKNVYCSILLPDCLGSVSYHRQHKVRTHPPVPAGEKWSEIKSLAKTPLRLQN